MSKANPFVNEDAMFPQADAMLIGLLLTVAFFISGAQLRRPHID